MNLIISNSDKRPIYQQISDQLKAHIISNTLKEGEKLPSIRVLAKELKISVITTKRAYDDLEKEGYLTTVPGKGTFVNVKDKNLVEEGILKEIESLFSKGIQRSRLLELSIEELQNILEILYLEE